MTFANDGFVSPPLHRFILSPSLPSSPAPQPDMHHPRIGTRPWSPDPWSPYYTPNHSTSIPNPHDSPTFDPTCICPVSPPDNSTPSAEQLKHTYPSPPSTDSDPKHTVPLPTLSEDSPSHAARTSPCHSDPLTRPRSPTLPTQHTEAPFTSHPSTQDLPLSPPPSLQMVPHALPEATTPFCTLDKDAGAHDDAQVETDAIDGDSQSSASPEEPPPSDLLTPLSPIWDLPLDVTDTRPAGTLEVSTSLLRSLVPPVSRLGTSGIQATEGDSVTPFCGSNTPLRGPDSKVESLFGQLRSSAGPPDGIAGPRFSIFHASFPSPNFDGLPSDAFLTHPHASSGGKLFVDSPSLKLFLSDLASPHVLPQLTLPLPLALRRRISLPSPSLEEPATHTENVLVSPCRGVGTLPSFCATSDMLHHPGSASVNHKGTEPYATSSLFQHCLTSDPAPPLSEFGEPSIFRLGMSAVAQSTSVTPNPGPMKIDDPDCSESTSLDSDALEQEIVPPSPMCRTLSDLHDDDEDFGSSSIPSSPSRRSFADLPEDFTMNEQSTSPPQSPLLAGQPLLTLPGAEPDNSLIIAETPVSDWTAASPPRGSGLGLFVPIQAASSNQTEASETHAIEPNLNFSLEAIARVDGREFDRLKSVRRRTWVSERKAKDDEIFHAKRAESLAGRLSVAPPVPSKLADFDERGGVSAGADETEGPPGEPAQLAESDEKTIRSWLLYTEARRAEARRVRKREKELGRELQALLRLKLDEDPDASEHPGGVKVKPGKTAIVSMPQLVARMILKRRDTPRPFSPRKHDAQYIRSPLSPVVAVDMEKRAVSLVRHTWFPHVSLVD
ncbi:hypothetical protein BC827DRAFT_1204557 [Russula dissimulans]|nr:hypothetical protein BC827DRAFT_1204557 [Russula dissimulans]